MKARQLFQRLTSREKTLLCAFVWVILLTLFIFSWRGFRLFLGEWNSTGKQLAEQNAMLALAPETDAQLQLELEFFNPELTFDSAALTGRVDALARQTGINLVNFNTRSQESDIYDLHIMRLSVRDTPMEALMAFDAALEQESPYINQVSVSIDADRRTPEMLDATIILNSFELKPGGIANLQ